jgi:endonuclease-8
MPEGDTIYRTARTLGRALSGETLTGFRTEVAQIAAANDQTPFLGQVVTEVESRGKWLLIHIAGQAALEDEEADSRDASARILATHMLMSGSWHIYRPGERWQQPAANMRIVLETAGFVAVAFRVPVAKVFTPQSLAREPRIPLLASDVLRPDFDPDAALIRLQTRAQDELANALLDQRILAGVGNVFKSEICFLARISPFARVSTLTPEQGREVVFLAQRLLAANVLEDSGDTIVTYQGRKRRTTRQADPSENLWVYGRRNEPCRRCGQPIERCLQGPGARVTYWCPYCQPLTAE